MNTLMKAIARMDFANTKFTASRSLWSYAKVQSAVSEAIRGRSLFFKQFPSGAFLLDLGPGPNLRSDFYNIDFMWKPGIDRCVDIRKGMALPAGRAAGAFTEHCLEHIDVADCANVLAEVHRSLVPGAWLRIVVPDLETYARRYVASIESGINEMPYATATIGGLSTPAVPFNIVMREHEHRFIYDFPTLRQLLERTGFRNVTKCRFGEGNDPRLLRDTPHRSVESLYVEAQK